LTPESNLRAGRILKTVLRPPVEMLLGRARDGSVRVSESEGERIDAWQRIVTCLAVFFLPKIEAGRLPMLDPVVAPPMARNYTAGKERIQCTFADQIKGKDWIGNKKDQIDLIFFLPVLDSRRQTKKKLSKRNYVVVWSNGNEKIKEDRKVWIGLLFFNGAWSYG
jgi:hypothetical protein